MRDRRPKRQPFQVGYTAAMKNEREVAKQRSAKIEQYHREKGLSHTNGLPHLRGKG